METITPEILDRRPRYQWVLRTVAENPGLAKSSLAEKFGKTSRSRMDYGEIINTLIGNNWLTMVKDGRKHTVFLSEMSAEMLAANLREG